MEAVKVIDINVRNTRGELENKSYIKTALVYVIHVKDTKQYIS